MTQEQKQILLVDLCTRFPYKVICELSADGAKITDQLELGGLGQFIYGRLDVKPFLRPMNDMTEGEKEELLDLCCDMYDPYHDTDPYDDWRIRMFTQHVHDDTKKIVAKKLDLAVDYLNAHHFDYRGLIQMGLALEAPEGMYNI